MTRRRKPRHGELFEKGILATFVGGAILVAPLILGDTPVLRAVAAGLQTFGWIAIGLGAALLIVHRLMKRHSANVESPSEAGSPRYPGSRDIFPPGPAPAPGESPAAKRDNAANRPETASARMVRQHWSREVFSDIEWRRFEAVCERLFAQGGFETKSQSHGADGGVDIWLYSKHLSGPAAVVQCKHWLGNAVGVKELREFFGVMASKGLKRGTYVTSSTFTPAAVEFAKGNGINILDGERLLGLIGRRTEKQQQELLAIAYQGDYWRPTCASCGVKMVERVASGRQIPFWGCTNFPRCRTTMPAGA